MGRLIRVAVAALVLWACWQAGSAQWQHFRFADVVQQLAQFGVNQSEEAIEAAVLAEASRLGIAVQPERVSVRRQGQHLYIDVTYSRAIEILPRYTYPWTFTVSGHGWFVPGGQIRK